MASIQRKEQLKNFLQKFDQNPILLPNNINDLGRMGEFLLAYFGNCFIEGYRLIEKIGQNMFLLSLMNISQARNERIERFSEFKLVCVEFEERAMEERSVRAEKYKQINEFIKFFSWDGSEKHAQGIQIVFVFAKTFMVSKQLTLQALQRCSSLSLKNFYNRDYKIFKKGEVHHGLKVLSEVEQGRKLHELVEMYIKGSASICNEKYVSKSVFHHSKFGYNVEKVINTVCLIIGKEMIQGGFVSMTSQKWMRKFSEKKFKKFDLLLRNEKKVCIIDWKFSKLSANEKINTQQFTIKNKQYFQLARKQYNAEVELRFYCFNQNFTNHYHQYTFANYHYDIDKVEINDHEFFTNQCNQIQIQDSDDQKKPIPYYSNSKTAPKNRKAKKYEEDDHGSSDEYCDVIIDSNKGVFEWKNKSKEQIQSQHIPQKYLNHSNTRVNESKGSKENDKNLNKQVHLQENNKVNIINLSNEEEFYSFSSSLEIIGQNCNNVINIEDEQNVQGMSYDQNKQTNQEKEQQMEQEMPVLSTENRQKNIKKLKTCFLEVQQQQGQIIQIEETQKGSEDMKIGQAQQTIMDESQAKVTQVQCQEVVGLTQNLKIKPFKVLLTSQPITHNQHPINYQTLAQPANENFFNNQENIDSISLISPNQKHSKQNQKNVSSEDNFKDQKLKSKQKDRNNKRTKSNQDSSAQKQVQNHLISIQNRQHTKQNCNSQIFVNSSSDQIKENRNKNRIQKPLEDSFRNINSDASLGKSILSVQNMEIQIVTDLTKEKKKVERKVREIQIRRQTEKDDREVERPKCKSRTILYLDQQTKHNSFIRLQEMVISKKGKKSKSIIDLEDDDCVVID